MNVLRPIQKEYYGDDNRWFLGYVINSTPPSGLEGRVKVRIIGVHNPDTGEIAEKDLPWAQVLIPTTEGGSSGIGRIPQIVKGAFVFGIFLDGTASQIPLVLGSLPRTELPTSIQKSRAVNFDNGFEYDQGRIQNVVIESLKDDDLSETDIGLRRLQCMKFFLDNGYNVIHSAAITGALEQQSNFKTWGDDITVGIALWPAEPSIGSRYSSLLRFADSYIPSSDWRKFSIQLQFVLFELRTTFNLANSKLLNSEDIEIASKVINKYYLSSSNSSKNIALRVYEEVTS